MNQLKDVPVLVEPGKHLKKPYIEAGAGGMGHS
jgi:hypothetical protein